MTLDAFIKKSTDELTIAGIETARLDCLVLLEDALGKDRSWLLAHPEFDLPASAQIILRRNIARRKQHEPLAYIRGKVEFYGREFYVDTNVLVPRPETESFIELLKKHILNTNGTRILDLGTGSGCIGITVVLEYPGTHATLADIDSSALHIARKNAAQLHAKVTFATSDLLSTIDEQFDIIATNLPYVPDKHPVNEPVHFEPALALYAGSDGMDVYQAFWQQVRILESKPSFIMTESLLEQHELQANLAARAGYKCSETLGLVQLFKNR